MLRVAFEVFEGKDAGRGGGGCDDVDEASFFFVGNGAALLRKYNN